jgi:hypothetical protein
MTMKITIDTRAPDVGIVHYEVKDSQVMLVLESVAKLGHEVTAVVPVDTPESDVVNLTKWKG